MKWVQTIFLVFWGIFTISVALGQASEQSSGLPLPAAYQVVGQQYAVPADILYSVCRQESGITYKGVYHPWPWTLNIAGVGQYFESSHGALAAVRTALADSQTACRIDIGLCQIHWCSHSHRVSRAEDLLNPYLNLAYAARLLREEYDRHGSWTEAIGRYHSYRPERAVQYRQLVVSHLQAIRGETW